MAVAGSDLAALLGDRVGGGVLCAAIAAQFVVCCLGWTMFVVAPAYWMEMCLEVIPRHHELYLGPQPSRASKYIPHYRSHQGRQDREAGA